VEVAAHIEDEPAAIEVECLDEQMVDDAGGLAGAGLAEDRDVLGRVSEVEGDVGAALESGGVTECRERPVRATAGSAARERDRSVRYSSSFELLVRS